MNRFVIMSTIQYDTGERIRNPYKDGGRCVVIFESEDVANECFAHTIAQVGPADAALYKLNRCEVVNELLTILPEHWEQFKQKYHVRICANLDELKEIEVDLRMLVEVIENATGRPMRTWRARP